MRDGRGFALQRPAPEANTVLGPGGGRRGSSSTPIALKRGTAVQLLRGIEQRYYCTVQDLDQMLLYSQEELAVSTLLPFSGLLFFSTLAQYRQ